MARLTSRATHAAVTAGLAATFVLGGMPAAALAENAAQIQGSAGQISAGDTVKTGSCGEKGNESGVSYAITDNGDGTYSLVISGSGAMGSKPWNHGVDGIESDPYQKKITSVVISEGVTTTQGDAFHWMPALKSVSIPASMETIGDNSFLDTDPNIKISVASGNTNYTVASNGILFSKDLTKLIYCPAGITGDYTVPSTVTSLASNAFNSSQLSSIDFSQAVGMTAIAHQALSGLKNAAEIVLPKNITELAPYVFYKSTNTFVRVESPTLTMGGLSFAEMRGVDLTKVTDLRFSQKNDWAAYFQGDTPVYIDSEKVADAIKKQDETKYGTLSKHVFYVNGGTVQADGTVAKEGYAFDGWYRDQALTDKVDDITSASKGVYYAKWGETVATVTSNGVTTPHASFSAAINAAKDGDTVTLVESTSERVKVEKKITVTAKEGAVYSGTMSVHDGATITGMTFSLDGKDGTTTSVALKGAGDVTISGNEFTLDKNAAKNDYKSIHLDQESARATINDNTFNLTASAQTSNYSGIYLASGTKNVSVSGNTFSYPVIAMNKTRIAVDVQGSSTSSVTVSGNTLSVTGDTVGEGMILLVSAFGNSSGYGITGITITDNTVTAPESVSAAVRAVSVQGVSGLTFTGNTVKGADVALGGGSLPGQKTQNADVTVGGNDLAGTSKGYNLGWGSLEGSITITKPDISAPVFPAPNLGATLIKGDGTGAIYATLKEAIDAADSESTVTMQKDLTEDITIPTGKVITLDLAGHTLTNKTDHTITNNGTLTVADSSAGKSGAIDNVTDGKAALCNEEGATATLKGGTFKRSKEDSDKNSYYTLLNHGTMTIEATTKVESKLADGTFAKKSALIDNGWYSGEPKDGKNALLTINGGTFEGGNYVENDSYGELVINGGTFKGSSAAVFNWNKLTINGGEFSAADAGKQVIWNGGGSVDKDTDGANVGQLKITGGTFTATDGQKALAQYADKLTADQKNNVSVEISGGTFKGALADNLVNARLSGGSYTVEPKAEYVVDGSGLKKNEDGTFGVQKAELAYTGAAKDGVVLLNVWNAGQLSEKDLLDYVVMNVEGYTVSVDTEQMKALNEAIAAKKTGNYKVTYTAAKQTKRVAGNSNALTVTVTFKLYYSGGGGTVTPTPKTYTVTFDDNVSYTTDQTAKVTSGQKVTKPADPELKGYVFKGWFTDAALKEAYDFSKPVTGDLTLHAKWALATTDPVTFSDVDPSQWYAPGVDFVTSHGLMLGYGDTGLFGVGRTLTRGELAVILARFSAPGYGPEDFRDARNETGLPDVADGQFYTWAANWAVENGVINGYADAEGNRTGFGPNDPVTMEQLVAIIANLVDKDGASKADASILGKFRDPASVTPWATKSVAWAVQRGLINGSAEGDGLYLRPTGDIMRERVAAILMNAFHNGILSLE